MSLNEIIKNDLVNAMKSHDTFKVSVLRMLKSELQLESISLKKELTDSEIMAVIKKNIKKRKDAITELEKYDKKEEVKKNIDEIAILKTYLPEELKEEEIIKEIDNALSLLQPTSIKEMGKVMKYLTEKIGNVADMATVSAIVKEKLNN